MSPVQLQPEVCVPASIAGQQALPLATDGVLRYVWETRFGAMLVEVVDGVAFVNGQRVEPAESLLAKPAGLDSGMKP